jgi:hypothetical protein
MHQMPKPAPDTPVPSQIKLSPDTAALIAALKLAEEQKANYEKLLQKISVFKEKYTNTKKGYDSFVNRKRDQVKTFAHEDKIKEISEYNEIKRITPAILRCNSNYIDLQRTQEQLKDSAGTILRELRDTLEPDKINTLTQQLKEIVSNLDDNVLRCRETIDQFTKLTDRAKELLNSFIKIMESSLPKDTNPAAGDTAADQEAATSEADMKQQLEQFLEISDVKKLSNGAALTEISESLILVDVFHRKTKVVYELLKRYSNEDKRIQLTKDKKDFFQEIRNMRTKINEWGKNSNVDRLKIWAKFTEDDWKSGKHSFKDMYERLSKYKSQFFQEIQEIKKHCNDLNKSLTKFDSQEYQQRLDGLVEALKKHLSDPPNGQEQPRPLS